MDNDFIKIRSDDKDCIGDIENFQDKSAMLQVKHQVDSKESEHAKQRQQGREEQNTFGKIPLKQGDNTALYPASRTSYSCMFLK